MGRPPKRTPEAPSAEDTDTDYVPNVKRGRGRPRIHFPEPKNE